MTQTSAQKSYINQKQTTLPVLFADDISILIKCDKTSNPNVILQNTLETVTRWLHEHNLEINCTKTKMIQFRSNIFPKIRDTHNVNTRHKNRLYLPPSRIKMLHHSPYYMAVKIFNKLPEQIKEEPKFNTFNRKLKEYLIQKCFYTVAEYLE
ncbi:hypothetical protein SFRURICE_014819 [Spodoptera frugiperda]|nr:hypothetical protein SFRURICE_014819 [Spodoptera frugiperda]